MCAKKRPNESQAKRMKEGFFFEGLTSALSDSDKSRTSGRHSTKDSPQYLTILAKVQKSEPKLTLLSSENLEGCTQRKWKV